MRARARLAILVLAVAMTATLAGCKALPKPKVPSLGGDVTSPIAAVR
jgi:type IV pilus biogenesis protein CpaD/CtpE